MNHEQYAVWATMESLPGKEDEVRAFLHEAARRLGSEPGTTEFFAMEIGERRFAIFNLFMDEAALSSHVQGEVARWVQARQPELFVEPYDITRATIFATKQALASRQQED